tara:strand:+ start:87 stop:845 length:759 start_codon:yes stop_codon:yes gene_type:complete
MFEIFILSLIQGVTEFLPISSSSHLIIANKFLNLSQKNLLTDISLHIGSFLAVLTFFRQEIFNFLQYKKLFYLIFLSSLPVMIFGFLFIKFDLVDIFRNLKTIGWTTFGFGIFLYLSDKFKMEKKIETDFNFGSAMFIGIVHCLSIIPGVSRSGIAITAARFLNFDRHESAKISFLLSIPTLFAVSCYGFFNLYQSKVYEVTSLNLLSIIGSFIISYLTIKYFLKFIKKFSLLVFVIYRLIIGIILLLYAYL